MRPIRFPGFDYIGLSHYSLTMCTFRRRTHFANAAMVESARRIFFSEAGVYDVVIPAYCFMPDHVHLVVSGRSERSDLVSFGKRSRQKIAFTLRHDIRPPFWQDGYYDHVLRDHESLAHTIRYVANNPVRAGLVEDWDRFPFTGSQLGPLGHVHEWLDEGGRHDEDALLGLIE